MAGSTAGREMKWKTNKSTSRKITLYVLYLYPFALYLVLDIFIVTIVEL